MSAPLRPLASRSASSRAVRRALPPRPEEGGTPHLHHLIPVTFVALVLIGAVEFEPWPQVTYLRQGGLGSAFGDFHFYRLLIATPGLAMDEVLPGRGFSLWICAFVAISADRFRAAYRVANGRPVQGHEWAILIAFFLLMNGRGAIGWAGWLVCLHLVLTWIVTDVPVARLRTAGLLVFGLLCASVSSGIFLASVALVAYGTFRSLARRGLALTRAGLPFAAAALLVTPFVVDYLGRAAAKVILFYGSGLDGVLGAFTHGVTSVLGRFDPLVLMAGLATAYAVALVVVTVRGRRIGPDLLVLLAIPIAGSVLGITIMTLGIPVLLIVMGRLVRVRLHPPPPRLPRPTEPG